MAIPLKTIDPGDIETYGYENEVLLMQEITPPSKLDGFVSKNFHGSELARLRENLHSRRRHFAVGFACSINKPARERRTFSRVIGVCFRKTRRGLTWRAPIGAGLDLIFA
jgi:hypothetical protein